MGFGFRSFLKGIRLVPVLTSGVTVKGDLEVLDSTGKLNLFNGTSASPVVTEAHAATLTNKVIDGSLNTLTNISSGSLPANIATTNTAQTFTNKSISGSANTLTNIPFSALPANTATTDTVQTFTNKTIDGNNNTILNVSTTVANNTINENKLTTSVAGDGLSGGNGTALAVNVDNSTIEINSDTLRVKDLGIVTAKIADANVTATKIETNPNFNGKASKVASQMIVTSANPVTNGLLIIRGRVSSSGTLEIGEGFTSSRLSLGRYQINFTTSYASSPVVLTTPEATSGNARIADIDNSPTPSSSSFTVLIFDAAGGSVDARFNFVVIGERA